LTLNWTLPGAVFYSLCWTIVLFRPVSAQETVDCGYPLNQEERSYCADKALEQAEAGMAAAYVKLHARVVELDGALPDHLKGSPDALEKAQTAWTEYADKDCKAYAFPFLGGPNGDELYRNCKIVLTMKRTDDLTATLEDYGN